MSIDNIHLIVAAILIVISVLDARIGRIPNWSVYSLIALFALKVFLFPTAVNLTWQLSIVAAVFVAGLALFAVGAMGAGAIKLVSATMLFMPLDQWIWLLAIFVGSVFVYLILFVFMRGIFGSEDSSWSVMKKRVVPMAWPIGTMGLLGLFVF